MGILEGREMAPPKRHKPLNIKELNVFLTKFCDDFGHHDYSYCLQWHSNISRQISNSEVKKKHLRRPPLDLVGGNATLLYANEKCTHPDACPDGTRCTKCHNEREFMYHPLVYMTAHCNNGASCKNRFCAFYHNEIERTDAKKMRE